MLTEHDLALREPALVRTVTGRVFPSDLMFSELEELLQQTVATGAAFLDDKRTGWRTTLRPVVEMLDVDHPHLCPLAQAYGMPFGDAVVEAQLTERQVTLMGFAYPVCRLLIDSDVQYSRVMGALTGLWRDEVLKVTEVR